ncbi:PAS domain-containing protein [Massilia sp. IC2-477]|uniref:PAS domain-containing protein n=1 Tax=Massilia sp. IC2-477 TaxID=2887198 RepID=UPI001D11575A|nr:PAS domain-containing protein [Massilia sp. IC2-477]MCC2954355.1 PAS domain-containing protein [Massilia sp. IC2-477]
MTADKQLFDLLPALVWRADPEHGLTFVNERWSDYTGLDSKAILGWGWRSEGLIHPEDIPVTTTFWTTPPIEDGYRRVELRIRSRDGCYRWFQCTASPRSGNHDYHGSWWGQNVDIDRYKRESMMLSGRTRLLEMIARDEALPCILDGICRLCDELSDTSYAAIILIDGSSHALKVGAAPNLPPLVAQALRDEVSHDGPTSRSPIQYISFPVLCAAQRPLAHLRIYSAELKPFGAREAQAAGALVDLLRTAIERTDNLAALNSSRERFAITVEAATDGHTEWIVATDTFYSSPRMLKLCGLPPDTVFKGRMDFVRQFPFHPDDREQIVSTMTAHFAGREVRLHDEMRMVVNGEIRWIEMNGICTRDTSGALVRWNAAITDITDRKRAQDALRESEERFTLAVTGSNQGVFDWNRQSDRVFMSQRAQEVIGIVPGDLWRSYDEWNSLTHPHQEDNAVRRQAMRAHLKDPQLAYDVEYRLSPNGSDVRWIRQRGVALRDKAGRVYRMAGSIEDITERKARSEHLLTMQGQLRQAQRLEAMGRLAGGIAHDFNNILGAILGYGEMALSEPSLPPRLRRDLDNIIIAGERGRALVDRILVFSRSSVGERQLVCVERIAREAVALARATIPERVVLRTRFRAGLASISGDPTQLHQLLSNLISNATGAIGHEGGFLTVAVLTAIYPKARLATVGAIEPGAWIILKVADSGCGITSDVMEHMFEPFFTTKEVGVGTGLGLSLVHSIVTDLGGALDIESKPGEGSVFTIYLPRAADAPRTRTLVDAFLPQGSKERITVVDDDELLLKLACENLAGLGYDARGFTASSSALAGIHSSPSELDLLITDERMPGMSGIELIRHVRQLRPELPIILVSGYLGGTVIQRAREAGANEVLKKPLSRKDLALSVHRVLGRD